MMDFTLSIYQDLLKLLITKKYSFVIFQNYTNSNNYLEYDNSIILRHDVDRLPKNSLKIAELEYSLGIKGSYFFRIVPESYNIDIISKIGEMGHEIGYHYEDVDLVLRSKNLKLKSKKDEEALIDLAYESFCKNLDKMRKIADIKTICMHGSPLSKYDNKIIWKKYDYRDLGIIGEPYLDIDWTKFAYFTDTGRCWNGNDVSIRDRVNAKFNFNFRSTYALINNVDKLPANIMITVHPQRWNDNLINWTCELISQTAKNIIKKYFYVKN